MYFVHCIGLSLSAQSQDSNELPVRFGGDRIHRDKGPKLVPFASQEEVCHYRNIHRTYEGVIGYSCSQLKKCYLVSKQLKNRYLVIKQPKKRLVS